MELENILLSVVFKSFNSHRTTLFPCSLSTWGGLRAWDCTEINYSYPLLRQSLDTTGVFLKVTVLYYFPTLMGKNARSFPIHSE